MLEMKDIVKQYRMGDEITTVLKSITLTVYRGEFLAVLGPSGSGKSTLMNIIGCLDSPTSGEYMLEGKRIGDRSESELAHIRSKKIGFIFQSFYLMKDQNALENVELPMIYAGATRKECRRRAMEMLEKVGLEDRMTHMPSQLSGGQQQRVAIARALVNTPALLLADEPTGALDQATGKQVMKIFHELNEEGHTIIMITHDAGIAAHAGRIVRILDGNLYEGGGVNDA
ncbi:MAG: ABC transporter ATP-binding protein [Solobacterium sp.]|nr:ABC transporter ATP-binding protein [Solobacterium sp.]